MKVNYFLRLHFCSLNSRAWHKQHHGHKVGFQWMHELKMYNLNVAWVALDKTSSKYINVLFSRWQLNKK